ncbi:MAG: hypothetical protein BGN88_09855 [Clostridiales bacterium 43-6]|nr:MAG: hypothetical protein BGN88_09855 [Clostridiales bacterium 43-6]
MEDINNMIYSWNLKHKESFDFRGIIDESIRDGLQDTRLNFVTFNNKCVLMDHMARTGINEVIVGMIGIDQNSDIELMKLIDYAIKVGLFPWVLCRLNEKDLKRLNTKYYKKVGINIFASFSNIRMFAENWNFNQLLENIICFADKYKKLFPAIRIAIEDATRTSPDIIKTLIKTFVELRIDRIVFADTAGIATPYGVNRLFDVVQSLYPNYSTLYTSFEWHGHNDCGMALANSLVSIDRGARYVHGTILGVGERTGNAAIELLLCNLFDYIKCKVNWEQLKKYFEDASAIFNIEIPSNYPFWGNRSLKSATGTHCAAMIKLAEKGYENTASKLFSPQNPFSFDLIDIILLSKLSGKKTVKYLMSKLNYQYDEKSIDEIINHIKRYNLVLSINDLENLIKSNGYCK